MSESQIVIESVSPSCNDQSSLSPKAKEESGRWSKNFKELLNYKKKYGDCLVPYKYAENPSLYMWVKRQRYQYSLFLHGSKESCMSPHRIKMLESIGFVWDVQIANWEKRFQELKEFKQQHGHCNLPSSYFPNKVLSAWVHRQRTQYKLFAAGKQSTLTFERVMRLEELGFRWEIRRFKRSDKPFTANKRDPSGDDQCLKPVTQMPITFEDYTFFMGVICDLSDSDDEIENLELATFKDIVPLECSTGSPSDQASHLLQDVIGELDSDSEEE
mmetsp:Transcript_26026/g.39400  ORF Transcript_26026/g.39400 Transcript_26026/m.39400 type:complete len:272 (-) Transcript_26026:11-826(-)